MSCASSAQGCAAGESTVSRAKISSIRRVEGNDASEPDNASHRGKPDHDDLATSRKAVVMTFVALTQMLQMIQFGGGINIGFFVAEFFGMPASSVPWVAASYPLTQGAFIITGDRFGAIYGHKNIMFVGSLFWVAFTLGTGFAPEFIALCILRAFSGIGGGILMPNCIALLGITFPPGRWRNISMALFVSCGPVGAAGGGLLAGIVAQLASWQWVVLALVSPIFGGVVFTTTFPSVSRDGRQEPDGKIDFVGSYLGIAPLLLFNFVWNQAPAVGWSTPYIYVLLIVSIFHAVAFAVWEAKFTSEPIVPITIWMRPSFTPLIICVFLIMMDMGVFVWNSSVWQYTIRGYTTIAAGASLSPILVTGGIMAIVPGSLIRYVKAQYIVAVGITIVTIALAIARTMPAHQTYWAQAFAATLIIGCGPDFVLTAGQVITSNSVQRHEQGIGGLLIGVVQVFGLSTGLGFAGTVERAIFLAVGFAALAMVINLVWVRMPVQSMEGWEEGDPQNEKQSREVSSSLVSSQSHV